MKIVHHGPAYAALIRSRAVQADLDRRARSIAAACGDDYYARSSKPHTRARAAVVAPLGDPENKMIRNLDAGRQ